MEKIQKVFLGSHAARESAKTALQGSATVNDSLPSDSLANSAGASTNLAEISETLDPLLQALDKDGQCYSITYTVSANQAQSGSLSNKRMSADA